MAFAHLDLLLQYIVQTAHYGVVYSWHIDGYIEGGKQ